VKDYGIRGVPLDPDFLTHQGACERCRAFDGLPASAANLCLEGSVLWKRENIAAPPPDPLPSDENRATKQQLRAVTRYKE